MNNISKLSLATTYEFAKDFDNEKFKKCKLKICHDGENLNNSRFSVDVIREAANSIKNSPILANVIFDDNGKPQFGSHDMIIEKNKATDDGLKMIYQEVPIGVIPESNNYSVEYDGNKYYACCDAYIWRGYSNYAEDILDRDTDVNLSMEISVDSWNLDAESGIYDVLAYRYTGVTLLGNDVTPAMEGASASLVFEKADSEKLKNDMLIIMQELKEVLASYKENNQEGGISEMNNEVIETPVVEEVSEEVAVVEEMSTVVDESSVEVSETVEPVVEEMSTEIAEVEEVAPEVESVASEESEKPEETEKFVKAFEYMKDDIACKLYAKMSESDCDGYIYSVTDTEFSYVNTSGNYNVEYSINENGVEFGKISSGATIISNSEVDSLRATSVEFESLKSEYESLKAEVEELRAYKAQIEAEELSAKKNEILEHWSAHLSGVEAFAELKSKIDEYSVEELEVQCKIIYADNTVKFTSNFSAKKKTETVSVDITETENNAVNDAYHGLFKAFN